MIGPSTELINRPYIMIQLVFIDLKFIEMIPIFQTNY